MSGHRALAMDRMSGYNEPRPEGIDRSYDPRAVLFEKVHALLTHVLLLTRLAEMSTLALAGELCRSPNPINSLLPYPATKPEKQLGLVFAS